MSNSSQSDSSTLPASRHPRNKRILGAIGALSLLITLCAAPLTASAYAYNGCKWSTPNLNVDIIATSGVSRTAIQSALSNYTAATDVNLTGVTTTGPTFKAQQFNYGDTGWSGLNTRVCPFGNTTSSLVQLNLYYVYNTAAYEGRMRLTWLHEIGHSLGLAHVTTVARVMYTSGLTAYNAGVRNLTFDEINGINALY